VSQQEGGFPPGKPLHGYRVLDLTRALAGPYCAMMLGDMGADVIKVEDPTTGDEARTWGPPFLGTESTYYLSMNRNKRDIAIDFKQAEGLALVLRLADRADVVLQNFRPGVVDRLGIGYSAVSERNPGVIYCSISAYGQDGPMASMPGYDLILQGVGGMMSVTGEKGGRPLKVGVAEADIVGGLIAGYSVLGALFERERLRQAGTTPRGRQLDVSLLDGQVSLLGYHLVNHLLTGRVPQPAGNGLAYIVPYQSFQTQTFEVNVAVNNDRLWQSFCTALERSDLAADQRFATNPQRVEQRAELLALLEGIFLERTGEEWLERLQQHGVPSGPINSIDRVVNDPQVQARGMLVTLAHSLGAITVPGAPWRLDRAEDQTAALPPPTLGQHTDDILRNDLGLTDATIKRLRAVGAVR